MICCSENLFRSSATLIVFSVNMRGEESKYKDTYSILECRLTTMHVICHACFYQAVICRLLCDTDNKHPLQENLRLILLHLESFVKSQIQYTKSSLCLCNLSGPALSWPVSFRCKTEMLKILLTDVIPGYIIWIMGISQNKPLPEL